MPAMLGARTGFEQFILDRQKQLSQGKKNYAISPEEYNKAAVEYFGKIEDKLPPGAKVVQTISPLEVIYELDGKQYRAFRNTDSNLGIDTGRIETQRTGSYTSNSDKLLESLLPTVQQKLQGTEDKNKSWLDALFNNANNLANQKGVVALDPATQALLDVITQAEQGQLDRLFKSQQGDLVSDLYGRGMNRSSVAATAAGELGRSQGLVQQQSNADAAARALGLIQFLTQQQQGNRALAGDQYATGAELTMGREGRELDFITQLLNRELQGVGLEQNQQQINNQAANDLRNFSLNNTQLELQAAQQRRANRMQLINSIIGGVTSLATGGLGSLVGKGLGSLMGGGAAKVGTASQSGIGQYY